MSMSHVFSRRGLSLERLGAFVSVAEAKGISRAAPGDPVRQSQLSRQISELESALEVALFTRLRRKLELSPAGQRLLLMTREFSLGISDLRQPNELPQITLGAGDSVLQWLVLRQLRGMSTLARLKLIALGGPQLALALEEHQLDLAVLTTGDARSGFKVAKLGRVDYGVFSCRRTSLPLAVITTEPRLQNAQATLGHPALECETFPQLMQAVMSGQFRGVLPLYARSAFSIAPVDIEIPPTLKEHGAPLLLAWRPRLDQVRPESTLIRRTLIDSLRKAISDSMATRS